MFFDNFRGHRKRLVAWYGLITRNNLLKLTWCNNWNNVLKASPHRSSHNRCSVIRGVLKKFHKFHGKHLCQSLFLNKGAWFIQPPAIGPHIRPSAPGPRSPPKFSTGSNSSNFKSSHYDQASLLSVVYGLSKPCWLTHATCTCCKETGLFFNVHWSCFVNFILCPTDKFLFKVNNEIIWLICWMCSKSKLYTTLHRSDVFAVDFDQSQ